MEHAAADKKKSFNFVGDGFGVAVVAAADLPGISNLSRVADDNCFSRAS